jgi:hypothetical protein
MEHRPRLAELVSFPIRLGQVTELLDDVSVIETHFMIDWKTPSDDLVIDEFVVDGLVVDICGRYLC